MSNSDSRSNERWRPIRGYEGFYEVSDRGRVRSLDRVAINRHGEYLRRGKILTPIKAVRTDHLHVRLCVNAVARSQFIHRLVLEAFVGPCPVGMESCHNNGLASDNRVENLRWDTPSSNRRDSVKHGTHHMGANLHRYRAQKALARSRPIWTPEDAAALAADAAAHPVEVGQSVVLDIIVQSEHLA